MIKTKQFEVHTFGGLEEGFTTKEAAINYANELIDIGIAAWVKNNKPKKQITDTFEKDSYLDNE